MPKQTDITGTFRIPEEHWGAFWNFMLQTPGADITPNTRAHAPEPKRSNGKAANGSTSKCIVLNALSKSGAHDAKTLGALIVQAGKAKGSVHNTFYDLLKAKLISGDRGAYKITANGKKYLADNCKGA